MTQMAYRVAVDLGTTYSAAAVCRSGDPRPEIVPLGGHSPTVASMVFLPVDGQMVCGEPARRRAVTDPRRVIREFKRRIGDGTPLVVGGQPVAPETVAARFVSWVLAVVGDREGGPAERVALTHPAEWGPHKREALTAALAEHGITDVLLLSEPEAAAIGYATTNRVEVGQTVAVYDLGGGTFDAAVVRKLADDRFELVGTPVGIEHLGGVDFDQAVFDHVRDAVGTAWDELDPADPAVQSAVAGLRRECTAAKEALSADTEVMVPVMLPGHHLQVRLGRTEFEEAIRPAVAETVEALRRALDSAGVQRPDAVLMVGGSSRIPLVGQLVSAELGRPVSIDADPKSVIAVGAAVAVRGPVAGAPAPVAASAVLADAAGAPTVVVPLTEEPACPPLQADPAPRATGPARRLRRGPVLALATALAVAATVGVGAYTLAASEEPLAAAPGLPVVVPEDAGGQAVVEGGAVDPWTGETATDTSLPGPSRPRAVAAATRPVARVSPTGAAGASAAAGTARTVDTNPPPGATVPAPVPTVPGQPPSPAPGPVPGPGPVDPVPDPVDPVPDPVDPVPDPVDPVPDPVDPVPDPVDPVPDPVDPEPVDPEPVDPAPVDPAPVDPAPADPPPSEGGGTTTTAQAPAPEPTVPDPTTPAVEPTA